MFSNANFPEPIRCSDEGSFAEHTLLVRLPEIARRVIRENEFPARINRRVERLIAEMPETPVSLLDDTGAPDERDWNRKLAGWQGMRWRDLSFIECEQYFYRRILQATRYFQPGPLYALDPYRLQKRLGLETSSKAISQLCARLEQWTGGGRPEGEVFYEALEGSLWGNRADLSLWPADGEHTPANDQLHQAEEFILVNDLQRASAHLAGLCRQPREVHLLIDNAGFELVYDLALADLFLCLRAASKVIFHLKAHPTFVSDALIKDCVETIRFLENTGDLHAKALGGRLATALAERRLALRDDFFWNAPEPFWDMPEDLARAIGAAGLVICKGDANYRRLTGDRKWEPETPFEHVAGYFPAPLLALRVGKSDVITGLQPGQAARLDAAEPAWRTNGRWGVIQFKHSSG